MTKFKILGLDDLLAHGVNTENDLIVNVVNKHVEDTILHMMHENFEFDKIDWMEKACEMADVNESGNACENIELTEKEVVVILIDVLDIWLVMDYRISVDCFPYDTPSITDIEFDIIKCFWLNCEFDLTKSEAIKTILRNELND